MTSLAPPFDQADEKHFIINSSSRSSEFRDRQTEAGRRQILKVRQLVLKTQAFRERERKNSEGGRGGSPNN
jgi:hypothetical protein